MLFNLFVFIASVFFPLLLWTVWNQVGSGIFGPYREMLGHWLVYLRLKCSSARSCENLWLRVCMGVSLCGEQAIQDVRRGDEDKTDTRSINNLLHFEIGIGSLLLSSPTYLLIGHEEEALGFGEKMLTIFSWQKVKSADIGQFCFLFSLLLLLFSIFHPFFFFSFLFASRFLISLRVRWPNEKSGFRDLFN